MNTYAQTNIQLFNQLRSEGYSQDERQLVCETYEFAMTLFSGLFLPSGKAFVDHVVGTASLLASLHVPIDLVAAGLIHAAYLQGDFGDVHQGITHKRRQAVRNAVGARVEDYVARYYRLAWNSATISNASLTLENWDPVDRDVLLIRLTNELEHHLDLAALYFEHTEESQAGHKRYLQSYIPILIDMSKRLGYPALAAELKSVCEDILVAQLPIEPCIRTDQVEAYFVSPSSYRERLCIRGGHTLQNMRRLGAGVLQRAKTAYRDPKLILRRLIN